MKYKTIVVHISHDENNVEKPYRIRYPRQRKKDLYPKSETAALTAVKRAMRDNKGK